MCMPKAKSIYLVMQITVHVEGVCGVTGMHFAAQQRGRQQGWAHIGAHSRLGTWGTGRIPPPFTSLGKLAAVHHAPPPHTHTNTLFMCGVTGMHFAAQQRGRQQGWAHIGAHSRLGTWGTGRIPPPFTSLGKLAAVHPPPPPPHTHTHTQTHCSCVPSSTSNAG